MPATTAAVDTGMLGAASTTFATRNAPAHHADAGFLAEYTTTS